MAGWYEERALNRSAKALIALTVLAVVLVAGIPVAFLIGLILMLLGHVVIGLAMIGGTVLAAGAVIGLASALGVRKFRQLRTLVQERGNTQVLRLNGDDYSRVN